MGLFTQDEIAQLQAMVRGVRDGGPTPAFRPLRPHRLDVFRYFAGLESAADEWLGPWRNVDSHSLQDTFEDYRHNQVSLCLCLTQRDRGSGAWQAVIMGGYCSTVDVGVEEAMEAFFSRGWIPSAERGDRRFYGVCKGCFGAGQIVRRDFKTGRVQSRSRCVQCRRVFPRSRTGIGNVLCDVPDSINALAHWTMLGVDTIRRAEGLASEIASRVLGVRHAAQVRWIPVTPRTWRPMSQLKVTRAWQGPTRPLSRVQHARGRAYFMNSAELAFVGGEGNPFVAIEELNDLGLALHDLTSEEVVIAYPTTS